MSSRRTRSLQPIARTRAAAEPVLGRGAHLGAARLPADAEHAAQRLQRAQRLLQLGHQDQRGVRRRRGSNARCARAPRSSVPPGRSPSARKAVTSARVRPTGRRRGAHSERGRPIRVRAIGVAISMPVRSPIHQVPQFSASAPVGHGAGEHEHAPSPGSARPGWRAAQASHEAGDVGRQRSGSAAGGPSAARARRRPGLQRRAEGDRRPAGRRPTSSCGRGAATAQRR